MNHVSPGQSKRVDSSWYRHLSLTGLHGYLIIHQHFDAKIYCLERFWDRFQPIIQESECGILVLNVTVLPHALIRCTQWSQGKQIIGNLQTRSFAYQGCIFHCLSFCLYLCLKLCLATNPLDVYLYGVSKWQSESMPLLKYHGLDTWSEALLSHTMLFDACGTKL